MVQPGEELDRESPQPVHEQLSDLLRREASLLGPGARLPTELALAERYRVSRATVRHALDTLVAEGLLDRQRAKGTFVRHTRMVHPLDQLRPFVAMFTEAGMEPQGKLVIHEWITDPRDMPGPIAALGGAAMHVRRLYRADDVAPAIADMYIPRRIGEQITRTDLELHPVYQVMQSKLGLSLAYADVVVQSEALRPEFRDLELEVGSPLLVLERTTYDASDQLLECTKLYLRPDSIELRLRVQAEGSQGVSYNFSKPGAHLALVNGRSR